MGWSLFRHQCIYRKRTPPTLQVLLQPGLGIAQLRAAGAKVRRVQEPLHAKMLLVDDALFVEGSFNWLSASRDDQYAKFESSVSYAGPRVAEHIEKARSLLGKLAAEELRAP